MLVISAESHHHLGLLQPFNMGKKWYRYEQPSADWSNAYNTKAGCQIPLRDSQKRRVAANLQPLPTCQIYTCFMESGPPHLKCTTLILSALPLTSLFAWKPPHDVAGINSSNLGGHSNAGVRTPSTKLAPLAPELCSDTKYSEIIFHDACVVRILALLDDVTHYCVTSEVEDYFRKWYDGFRWFRPICHSTWRRSLSREACVLWDETWEGLKLQKGFEYELSNTIVMSFILFSRFHSPHT